MVSQGTVWRRWFDALPSSSAVRWQERPRPGFLDRARDGVENVTVCACWSVYRDCDALLEPLRWMVVVDNCLGNGDKDVWRKCSTAALLHWGDWGRHRGCRRSLLTRPRCILWPIVFAGTVMAPDVLSHDYAAPTIPIAGMDDARREGNGQARVPEMNVSLDGFVDHTAFVPDQTLFRHFVEEARTGGKQSTVMTCTRPCAIGTTSMRRGEDERAFAAAWRRQPVGWCRAR